MEAIHYNNSQANFRIGEIYANRSDVTVSGEHCYTMPPSSMVFYASLALVGIKLLSVAMKYLTHNPYLDTQPNDLGLHNEWHPSAL